MANTKDLEIKRKQAYEYIKNTLHQPPWHIPLNISDTQLADKLGGTIALADSLRLLREGKHNPTNRLIIAFKNLVGEFKTESEINSHLIDPFN